MQHKISVALIHQFSITVTPKNAFLGVKFGGGYFFEKSTIKATWKSPNLLSKFYRPLVNVTLFKKIGQLMMPWHLHLIEGFQTNDPLLLELWPLFQETRAMLDIKCKTKGRKGYVRDVTPYFGAIISSCCTST